MHRTPFPTKGHVKATEVCELVHGDVRGPTHVSTFDDFKYYSLLKDDYINYIDVKLIKKKNGVVEHIMEFYERIKNQTGKLIKVLRTGQGREYEGERLATWKKQKGIIHQTTNHYTPQQNGVSERSNRTVMDSVRSSIYNNNSSNQLLQNTGRHLMELWGEFLCATVYVRNRSVSSISDVPQYEKLFNKRPSVAHLRILGCRTYAHVPDAVRKCWFVGYCDNIKGWRLWDPVTRKIIISRDVFFDETILIGDTTNAAETSFNPRDPFQIVMEVLNLHRNAEQEENPEQPALEEEGIIEPIANIIADVLPAVPSHSEKAVEIEIATPVQAVSSQNSSINPVDNQHNYRRSWRIQLLQSKKSCGKTASTSGSGELSESDVDEPKSYKEAVQSKYAAQWMKAFEEEYQSIIENKSWELVLRSQIPTNSNVIGHKWIGKYKPGYGEVPARFKDRLTAVGCRQRYGIDFDETFAPVPRSKTVRATLSLMANLDMDIIQIDIKTAFLNATLDKPVYMTQPEGFIEPDKEDHVCRLPKALYGTKQAPRLWNKRLEEAIRKFGLKPISADTCIFVRTSKEDKSILIKFVDDLVYGSTLGGSLETFSQFMSA
jgi:hypothetical protein